MKLTSKDCGGENSSAPIGSEVFFGFLKIFLLVTFVFICSLLPRIGYFGTLSDGHNQWLTGSTVKFVDNWLEDGILNDGFLMLERPKSIESNFVSFRDIYASYPSGAIIPVYLMKLVIPGVDTIYAVHSWNLFNQYLIGLLIAAFVYLSLPRQDKKHNAFVFSALSGASYIFLRKAFYWHEMAYFADQAAILPFAVILMLEMLIRTRVSGRGVILLGQSFFLFVLMSIDYLAVPVALVLWSCRILYPMDSKDKGFAWRIAFGSGVQIFSPVLVSLVLFLASVYLNGQGDRLFGMFLVRTGIVDSVSWKFPFRMMQHIGYPESFAFLFSCWILFVKLRAVRDPSLVVCRVAFLAVLLHTLMLTSHSAVHGFSGLKFQLPLSLAFFGVIPSLTLFHFESVGVRKEGLVSRVSLILLCGMVLVFSFGWKKEFPPKELRNVSTAKAIKQISSFEDVYLSMTDFEIPNNPPQLLSVSRKRVYRFNSGQEAMGFIMGLPKEARIHFIVRKDLPCLKENGAISQLGEDGFFQWTPGSIDLTGTQVDCLGTSSL